MAVDLSSLEDVCVREFTDGPAGSNWVRLRQAGPSVPDAAGDVITPEPTEAAFRAFVDEGGAKLTVKQPRGQGDQRDGTVLLFVCQRQVWNGLNEDVDFIAADDKLGRRADTVRRETTGELWELQAATLWEAGRFWALQARLVNRG